MLVEGHGRGKTPDLRSIITVQEKHDSVEK